MPPQLIRYGPFIVGAAVGTTTAIMVSFCRIEALAGLPVIGTTFGVIVSGFTATQRNIILALGGTRILRFLAQTGYHNDVLTYLMDCVYMGIVVSITSIIGMFVISGSLVWVVWLGGLTGAVSATFVLLVRNEILVAQIIKRFMEESNPPRN